MNLEVRLSSNNDEFQPIDYHIIFSDKLQVDVIKNFLSNLEVIVNGKTKKANSLNSNEIRKSAIVDFKKLIDTLEDESLELKGNYLKAFPSRGHGNGVAGKSRSYTIYEEITRRSDIILNSSTFLKNLENDKEYFLGENENSCKYVRPLLQSSDAHSVSDIGIQTREIDREVTELKSQVSFESEGKYYIEVPGYTWIKSNPSFDGLKQIIYEPRERISYGNNEPFYKNPYLVIDRIEYDTNSFIYLNESLNTIIGGRSAGKSTLLNTIAKCQNNERVSREEYHVFDKDIKVIWKDGVCESERDVEFIPQDYMVNVSNDKEVLNELVNKIISKKNMDSKEKLFIEKNIEISKNINKKLDDYFLLISKRESMIKPEGDEDGVQNAISDLNKKLSEIRKNNNFSDSDEKEYKEKSNLKDNLTRRRSEIEIDINDLESVNNLDLQINNDLTKFKSELKGKLNLILNAIIEKSKIEWDKELTFLKNDLVEEKESINYKIKEIIESDIYIRGQELENASSEIGDLEKKLENNKTILNQIINYKNQLNLLNQNLDDLSEEIVKIFCDRLRSLKEFEHDFEVQEEEIKIIVETEVIEFNENIDILNGRNKLNNEFISNFDQTMRSCDIEKIEEFLKSIFNQSDLSFNKSKDINDLIKEVFTSDWFKYNYNIIYQNDEFREMSQGKKSFVILKLLLDFSDDKKPVLIDQPEDSLDNRAIYKELRHYLLKTKRERQIILVTHNPNIVVGADAENIIVANQHSEIQKNKNNRKFQYINGALEDTKPREETDFILESQGIREHIFDVLEGGFEAFTKREQKYKKN